MRNFARFTPLAARCLIAFASLAALGSARVAHAQPAQSDGNQQVIFDDDLLNADLGGPSGLPVFTGHMRPPRTQLIRPRMHFLPELFKSVEHL
ncbi:MAG TPA: hypothetical protein VFK05_15245 [Polyangiaceae bacterium]|nr:hypothetical protein [Polyangiaceae bacterium]